MQLKMQWCRGSLLAGLAVHTLFLIHTLFPLLKMSAMQVLPPLPWPGDAKEWNADAA